MLWIAIGILVLVVLFLLFIFVRSGPQDFDEAAMKEAAEATPEELDAALHPPPKTKEQIEEEIEMYSKR